MSDSIEYPVLSKVIQVVRFRNGIHPYSGHLQSNFTSHNKTAVRENRNTGVGDMNYAA